MTEHTKGRDLFIVDNTIEKPAFKLTDTRKRLGNVHINKTQYFEDVPEAAWLFHIGGYQPAQKWLKDRQATGGKNPYPGRTLTDADIEHYQKIILALSETIRIIAQIDEVIEAPEG